MKKLDAVNPVPKKDEAELRNLREENARLRKRVHTLEETIASLQSTSVTMQKDMRDIRQSHDVLKVKVSNVREEIRNERSDSRPPTVQREGKASNAKPTETLPDYTLPTANRFDVLTQEPTSDETVKETEVSGSNQKQKRVVLIGDSNAHKLKPNLLCPTADIPMPYWSPNLFTAPTVMENISKEDTTPNTVILHMGTNDIMGKSKETVISEVEVVVSTTRSLFPEAEIVISAVPPRRDSDYRPNLNKDIAAINHHVEDMCKSNESLIYVNHSQMWTDGDYNPNVFEKDGYHLNNDGVRILAFNLKRQATSALGLTPAKNNTKSPRNNGRSNANKDNLVVKSNYTPYNKGRQSPRNNHTRRGSHDGPVKSDVRRETYNGPVKPNQYRQSRHGGGGRRSPSPYLNGSVHYTQPESYPGVPPNRPGPIRDPQRKESIPGTNHQALRARQEYFPRPAIPTGHVQMNRPTPTPPDRWLQEWPSPAEAYGGNPAFFRRPPFWFAPPPFPYYGPEGSWYGHTDGSMFGLNERPRGSG
ncbi:Hypp4525 [Branchiostoma lanceolatum]|uniref:1-alkyl-2-acetylglycerophosphocholine esterase n=1 Tax=Branchiostoma lanceolatum TaxID=7740 RepID=A0A8K0A8V6_BRALA|nr:Hypp4525 [Branchiostoma lanceolatum]